jgi:hypothetical protein
MSRGESSNLTQGTTPLKGSTIRITPPSDTRESDRRARPFVRPAFGQSPGSSVLYKGLDATDAGAPDTATLALPGIFAGHGTVEGGTLQVTVVFKCKV